MPSIRVNSYSVGIIRRAAELITRFITCIPEPSEGQELDSVVIYFMPEQESVGYQDGKTVVGFLPREDFGDVYHILQTETPVYINWGIKGEKEVEYLSVGTRQEPAGEGFHDRSP